MVHFIKKLRASHVKNVLLVSLLLLFLGVVAIASRVTSQRATLDSKAAENNTFKIMTFNVLSEPICRGEAKHKEEMARVMKYIKDNNISLAALQEVVKQNGGGCENFDLPQYIQDNASGYSVSKSEYIHISRDSDNEEDNIEKWWYRLFVQDSPMVGDMQRIQIGANHSGFDVMVMNTKLGPIRFIHLHNHHHQMIDSLVPLVNQFKAQDSIPIIVLGDFNIIYDGDNGLVDEFKRLKYLEDQAGLYRACDPNKFPNGGCTDTLRGTDAETNLAGDHIFIDNRAKFIVKNAYVDANAFESPTPFSDHLPVIVELIETPPTPTPTVCKFILFGDLSCDGVVSALDVACWTYQFRNGRTQTNCRDGNLNNDNEMDILDYTILKLQIGK